MIALSDTFADGVADVLFVVVPLWQAVRQKQARRIGMRRFIGRISNISCVVYHFHQDDKRKKSHNCACQGARNNFH